MKGWLATFAGVLAVALCSGIAFARPSLDLGARVFHLRTGASLTSWSDESLRGIGFHPRLLVSASASGSGALAFGFTVAAPAALLPAVRFGVSAQPVALLPFTAAGVGRNQVGSGSASRIDLASPTPLHLEIGSAAISFPSKLSLIQPRRSFLARVAGALGRVRTNVELSSPQSPSARYLTEAPPASDQVLGGQAKFAIRTGGRSLSVALSSRYEHLSRGLIATSSTLPALNPLGINGTARLSLPPAAFNNLSRSSLGASFALPVTNRFTVGVGFRSARVIGTFGSLTPTTIAGNESRLFGRLTYRLPNAPAAITFQARQYRFSDNLGLTPNLTQLRAGFNLTIKL